MGAPSVRAVQHGDIGKLATFAISQNRLEIRLQEALSEREAFLLAEIENQAVGILSIRWTGGCDGERPWLYGAEVRENFRNQGIGTALLKRAEQLAIKQGFNATALDVEVTNHRAKAFYERLGYIVVGPHLHTWQAIDPKSHAVTATGTSETWLMRKGLV